MKRLRRFCLSFLVLAGTTGLVIAPPPVMAGGVDVQIGIGVPGPAPVVYSYVYYPEAEVYFVPETSVYWWYAGGTWVSGPHVPSGIVLGSRTTLRVDAPEPWRHHDLVIQKFPGHGHHKHDRDKH